MTAQELEAGYPVERRFL